MLASFRKLFFFGLSKPKHLLGFVGLYAKSADIITKNSFLVDFANKFLAITVKTLFDTPIQ